MRLRFSLKRLLIFIAVLAISLFAWVLYPTAKATRCTAAINDAQLDPYQLVDRPRGSAAFLHYENATNKRITAELVRRSWSDILRGQRRFAATLTWYVDGSKYDRQQVVVIRATPLGYQLEQWQEMSVPHKSEIN
jgi:hypothetical protein